jgi:hypothetical protein
VESSQQTGDAPAVTMDPATSKSTVPPSGADLSMQQELLEPDDSWLHDFYKECGREVTLAYTTLNQMKNWAIVVQAAIIAAAVSFTGRVPTIQLSGITRPEFAPMVGASLAYLFTLRFFVRAILCYNNLLRWNQLQRSVINAVLLPQPDARRDGSTRAQRIEALRADINLCYYRWLATIPRKKQFLSNLKLGFGLLLALPAFLTIWGSVALWDVPLVRGIAFFVLGGTGIEIADFLMSGYFNDVAAANRRGVQRNPLEESATTYIVAWIGNLLVAALITAWPLIKHCLARLPP